MRWSGLIFPFLQRAKFNTCSFSLRSCRNNLWMKRYVLSIVKTVITLHQPRLFHGNRTEAHFLFMQSLSSDSCCQDLAQMTHQFPIHILPHQSNLHSLSPVISCRFEGCNLKHECCRFSNVCFSYSSWWLKKKKSKCLNTLCGISSMLKILLRRIHFLFTSRWFSFFPSLSTSTYEAIIFKGAEFKTCEGVTCARLLYALCQSG